MDVFPIYVIYFSKYEFCQSEEAVMYRTITLPNGARILTEHIPSVRSAALGFFVGAGSRHERAEENGAAHFIAAAAPPPTWPWRWTPSAAR